MAGKAFWVTARLLLRFDRMLRMPAPERVRLKRHGKLES